MSALIQRSWHTEQERARKRAERVTNGGPLRPSRAQLVVIAEAAAAHDLQVVDLQGASRLGHIVKARHEAMWRLRCELGVKIRHVGRLFGGRDHATASHGVRQHQNRLDAAASRALSAGVE